MADNPLPLPESTDSTSVQLTKESLMDYFDFDCTVHHKQINAKQDEEYKSFIKINYHQ